MYSNKEPFTRFTVEQSGKKCVWEIPAEDITNDDCMEAIHMLMIGLTFSSEGVYNAMAEFLQEHAAHKFDIYEHIEKEDEKE